MQQLSYIMLSELHYIKQHGLDISRVNKLHQTTLKSLLSRRLITRVGDTILVTEVGDEVLSSRKLNKRKHKAKLSDSVAAMLRVRKLMLVRKSA